MTAFLDWLAAQTGRRAAEAKAIREALLRAQDGSQAGKELNQIIDEGAGLTTEQRTQALAWRDLYCKANGKADPPPQPPEDHPAGGNGAASRLFGIERDNQDDTGNLVRRVYLVSQRFVIYAADHPDIKDDVCSLRYKLSGTYEQAKDLRNNLIKVVAEIACITDAVCGLKPLHPFPHPRYSSLRERAYELMARAMGFAFESHQEEALKVLKSLRHEIEARRDSGNRMRYIVATTISFCIILLAGLLYKETERRFLGGPVSLGGDTNAAVIDVLLFGAVGAFFSVVVDIGRVKVAHAIALAEMLYAGSIRIPVGVIAASIVALLIEGGWLLGAVTGEFRAPSLYLLSFLAGFSEMFIPNALKQVENGVSVAQPNGGASSSATAGAQ